VHELLKNMWLLLREFVRYLLFARGLFLMQSAQVLIFARSALLDESSATQHTSEDLDGHLTQNLPDIEIMPMAVLASIRSEVQALLKDGAASTLCVLLRPRSRGAVTLASIDPRARPRCTFNALSDPADMAVMKKAVRLGQAVGRRTSESGFPLGDVLIGADNTDADLERHIRENVASTYHYTSSCRMAPLAEGGVVDDRLRVHGIDGLRIADASVFPAIPSSHTQAPTVMVAERCVAFIRADRKGQ
jgi:choline dehydrogenase